MDEFKLTTPVAFFIYNRPDTTKRVFEQIRAVKPPVLLVVADGPRAERSDDLEKCALTRSIIERVDWDCKVLTNFSDVNLGCKMRVATGLEWVFDMEEMAIILEHDTLPHPSFFRFCQETLGRYKDDSRIMTISGCNFQFGKPCLFYSYYFSRYVHCWGWATWRRAWKHYDVNMSLWPKVQREGRLQDILGGNFSLAYWQRVFDLTYRGYVDTWDYQWVFACWLQNGLTVIPGVNLVSNIGFGAEATHTKGVTTIASMPTVEMQFPLTHPPFIIRNALADEFTQALYNNGKM